VPTSRVWSGIRADLATGNPGYRAAQPNRWLIYADFDDYDTATVVLTLDGGLNVCELSNARQEIIEYAGAV
jgi:hypothetical protein